MYIDYKISVYRINKDGSTTVQVRIYRGDIVAEDETDINGNSTSVTRYRRRGLLGEVERTRDNTYTKEQIIVYLNAKLKEEADARGWTVITEQSNV